MRAVLQTALGNLPGQHKSVEFLFKPVESNQQGFHVLLEINLGHIAALPILNTIAQILGEAGVDPEDIAPAIIQSRKDLFLGMVGAMMVEGIMIAHAPAWRDKMDTAVKGIRQIPDDWFGPSHYGLNM